MNRISKTLAVTLAALGIAAGGVAAADAAGLVTVKHFTNVERICTAENVKTATDNAADAIKPGGSHYTKSAAGDRQYLAATLRAEADAVQFGTGGHGPIDLCYGK